MESVEKKRLPVVCSLCCMHNLLYCDWPWCVGCVTLSECLCVGFECCLKCDAEPIACCDDQRENTICQVGCYCCGVYLIVPSTCVKLSSQLLCCVTQVTFPCDTSMPCVLTLCFWTMYPECACCARFGQMHDAGFCGQCVPVQPVLVHSPTPGPYTRPVRVQLVNKPALVKQ